MARRLSIPHHCPHPSLCPGHKTENSFAEFLDISSPQQDSVKEIICLSPFTVNDPVKENV